MEAHAPRRVSSLVGRSERQYSGADCGARGPGPRARAASPAQERPACEHTGRCWNGWERGLSGEYAAMALFGLDRQIAERSFLRQRGTADRAGPNILMLAAKWVTKGMSYAEN